MSCKGCPSAGNCKKDASKCGVQPNPKNNIRHIVAVMSGKGGVGKSTMTTLLARSLAKMGLKVGIMDADITGPSIPRLMGAQNEKAYATSNSELLPVDVDGIKIMSLNYLLSNESDPVIWRGPIVGNVVRQFYTDVIWGDLDVLLIDMPPGTGDVALTILQDLPVQGVIMVGTPSSMVGMIVLKAIKMCQQMNIPLLGIIENMAYFECPNCHERVEFFDAKEMDELLEATHAKLYATLPMSQPLANLHQYSTSNLEQQQNVESYIEECAKEVWQDLNR
jgi:Mrp family chromosome partitioning ATPase